MFSLVKSKISKQSQQKSTSSEPFYTVRHTVAVPTFFSTTQPPRPSKSSWDLPSDEETSNLGTSPAFSARFPPYWRKTSLQDTPPSFSPLQGTPPPFNPLKETPHPFSSLNDVSSRYTRFPPSSSDRVLEEDLLSLHWNCPKEEGVIKPRVMVHHMPHRTFETPILCTCLNVSQCSRPLRAVSGSCEMLSGGRNKFVSSSSSSWSVRDSLKKMSGVSQKPLLNSTLRSVTTAGYLSSPHNMVSLSDSERRGRRSVKKKLMKPYAKLLKKIRLRGKDRMKRDERKVMRCISESKSVYF